jgi:valyl-tRNA synthetase
VTVTTPKVPEKPTLDGLDEKWSRVWREQGIFRFDRASEAELFAIDTPPPTVSGDLHIGHVYSYTQTDVVARFQRMAGKEVLYPMGWDDNGLPTERRVQDFYGVRCDPSLPYDPDLKVEPGGRETVSVSRPNFVELCVRLTQEDERRFEDLWTRLGLSVDWSMTYTTIGARAQAVSQRSFLDLVERGAAYLTEAPTLWDVDFQTAVAQAELEDREIEGAWYGVRFEVDGGGAVDVETTRPELLPACVALVTNPDDERHAHLVGRTAVTPLFGTKIPVVAHELASKELGTGIAMVCTFGDINDVTWWRELGLPLRIVVRPDGTLAPIRWGSPPWESRDSARAERCSDELAGLTVVAARKRAGELLTQENALVSGPTPIRHAVKFYERGYRPLEILSTRQWFVKTLELREELIARGREVEWHPPFMRTRYENWVNGLNTDWCVSRQRYFGVPFPVWFHVDEAGEPQYDRPVFAAREALPVDPTTDAPPGFAEEDRGKPGGFVADPDVMDTWATSSLSPQIVSGWPDDEELFARAFPLDLRPQAHDIIRTWLFYTILRSHLQHDSLPWRAAAISGYVVDPARKKMSKSKGNVPDTPQGVLEEWGADPVRYWAARGRLGADTAFDPAQFRVGRRLAIKILNASRFILGIEAPERQTVDHALDRSLLAALAGLVDDATADLAGYEHTRAIDRVEVFFWSFCGDYLELVKSRAYGGRGDAAAGSALTTLRLALSTQLRLFAPFLPYVTEEVWSWWQEGSIHRAPWPTRAELDESADGADPHVLEIAGRVIGEVRKAKADARLPLRAPVRRVHVRGPQPDLAALRLAEDDVRETGVVERLEGEEAPELEIAVELDA